MSKFVTIIAVCALLCVSAFADTIVTIPDGFSGAFQTQTNANGIVNAITLNHGDSAQNIVHLDAADVQTVDNFPHVYGQQNIGSTLDQFASACADCGVLVVSQELGNTGVQWQLIGGSVDPKAQGQTQALDGVQTLVKSEGQGQATALQSGTVDQGQVATNSAGTLTENATVNSFQYSAATGQPGTTAAVGSAVHSTTSQSQMVY